jgi:hypothetical protein
METAYRVAIKRDFAVWMATDSDFVSDQFIFRAGFFAGQDLQDGWQVSLPPASSVSLAWRESRQKVIPKNPVMAKGIEAMKRMLALKAAALLALFRASELASPRAQVGHAETAGTMAKHAASTISRMDLLIMALFPAEAIRRTKR